MPVSTTCERFVRGSPIRIASVGFLGLIACAKASTVPPPAFRYNDVLKQANVQGPVRFRVLLDSLGNPELTTFEILTSAHPAFTGAVRNGLREWRDPSMAGRRLEQTVLFVLLDSAATDSIAHCQSSAREWLVCGRHYPPLVISVPAPIRVDSR